MPLVVVRVDVEPARRHDPSLVNRIARGGSKADALVVVGHAWKIEPAHLRHEIDRGGEPPLEVGHEGEEVGRRRGPVEPAHRDVDRMHGAAAHHLHDPAAEALQPQTAIHEIGVGCGQREAALHPHEVGRVEQMHVEGVALDPLAVVEEPAEPADPGGDLHAQRPLQRLAGRQLVGHRTDPANPGHDVGHLADLAAANEPLEEPRRLVDRELGDLHGPVDHADAQRSFPFHSGERLHLKPSNLVHSLASSRSLSARNAGAAALNDRTSRSSDSRGAPRCS